MNVVHLRRRLSLMSRIVCSLLIVSLVSQLFGAAFASAASESSRIAQIVSLSGEVFVKKSGGSKEFKAYKSMALNQGDYLRTGKSSSVTLKVIDHEDEMTIGANASLYLSKLKDADGGKKTNVTMQSGSAYVKAGKLKDKDTFQIETPTAVMGVRGTNFMIGVNHLSGNTDIAVASGIVQAVPQAPPITVPGTGSPARQQPIIYPAQPVTLYPAQQGSFLATTENGAITTAVAPFDPAVLVQSVGPEVIGALIRNASAIQSENEQLLQTLNNGQANQNLGVTNNDEFALYAANLNRLADVVATTAVQQGALTPQEVNQIAQQTGTTINTNAPPLQLTPAQQQQKQQAQQVQQKAQQQAEQKQQLQQQMQQQNAALLNQLQTVLQQQQQNQQALNQQKQAAEQKYLSTLTAEQRQQFEQNRANNNTPPVQTPPSNPGGGTVNTPPVVTLVTTSTELKVGDPVTAKSNKTGWLYLVPQNTVANLNELEAMITAQNGKKAQVTQMNTDVTIGTTGLPDGKYVIYATDALNAVSQPTAAIALRAVPANPSSVTFVDTNVSTDVISGELTIGRASPENNVTEYKVFWADNSNKILPKTVSFDPLIKTFKVTESLKYNFSNTVIPTGAKRFVVYTYNGPVESKDFAYTVIDDKKLTTPAKPTSITFTDENPEQGVITGTLTVGRASSEQNVAKYLLYWADENGAETFIASLDKTTLTHQFKDEAIPEGAVKFVAYTVNALGERSAAISEYINDDRSASVDPTVTYLGASPVEIDDQLTFSVNKPVTLYFVEPEPWFPPDYEEPRLLTASEEREKIRNPLHLMYAAFGRSTLAELEERKVKTVELDPKNPVPIEISELPPGQYTVYAVDDKGNVSLPSDPILVLENGQLGENVLDGTISIPPSAEPLSNDVRVRIYAVPTVYSLDYEMPFISYETLSIKAKNEEAGDSGLGASFSVPIPPEVPAEQFEVFYELITESSETQYWVSSGLHTLLGGVDEVSAASGSLNLVIEEGGQITGEISFDDQGWDPNEEYLVAVIAHKGFNGVSDILYAGFTYGLDYVSLKPGETTDYSIVVPEGTGYKVDYIALPNLRANPDSESSFYFYLMNLWNYRKDPSEYNYVSSDLYTERQLATRLAISKKETDRVDLFVPALQTIDVNVSDEESSDHIQVDLNMGYYENVGLPWDFDFELVDRYTGSKIELTPVDEPNYEGSWYGFDFKPAAPLTFGVPYTLFVKGTAEQDEQTFTAYGQYTLQNIFKAGLTTNNTIAVQWAPYPGAVSYELEIYDYYGYSKTIPLAITDTSYEFTDLTQGRSYDIYLKVYYSDDPSDYTEEYAWVELPTLYGPPNSFTVFDTNPEPGLLSGKVEFDRVARADETIITGYALYWVDINQRDLGYFTTIEKPTAEQDVIEYKHFVNAPLNNVVVPDQAVGLKVYSVAGTTRSLGYTIGYINDDVTGAASDESYNAPLQFGGEGEVSVVESVYGDYRLLLGDNIYIRFSENLDQSSNDTLNNIVDSFNAFFGSGSFSAEYVTGAPDTVKLTLIKDEFPMYDPITVYIAPGFIRSEENVLNHAIIRFKIIDPLPSL